MVLPCKDESSTSGSLQCQHIGSNVHMCLQLKLNNFMGLVHTFTKYWYIQEHTKDMHEYEQLFPNNMIMVCQVSRLAKLGLGKLVIFPNLD